MSINKQKIYHYVQTYGGVLEDLKIAISAQDKNNIYQLIQLLGELDDLYDQKSYNSSEKAFDRIRNKMTELIPKGLLSQKTIDILFTSLSDESNNQKHRSLKQYLKVSSITSGVQLIACYFGSLLKINPDIWFSGWINNFAYEIGTIVRLANDYLDLGSSQNRFLAEIPQENAILFFPNKIALKSFIVCKYILHKFRFYSYTVALKYLKLTCDWRSYLRAITCYESVLDLGFKAYFFDQEACRD